VTIDNTAPTIIDDGAGERRDCLGNGDGVGDCKRQHGSGWRAGFLWTGWHWVRKSQQDPTPSRGTAGRPAAGLIRCLRGRGTRQENLTTSATVNVTIDNTAPTISMTAPANGATVSGMVTVSATASDTRDGWRAVSTGRGGLGTGSHNRPYSISWNSTTAKQRVSYVVCAARDAVRQPDDERNSQL